MTTNQLQAMRKILNAVIDAVKASPEGTPEGSLYAIMMSQGCTLNQQSLGHCARQARYARKATCFLLYDTQQTAETL
jgi:hypothetical protein